MELSTADSMILQAGDVEMGPLDGRMGMFTLVGSRTTTFMVRVCSSGLMGGFTAGFGVTTSFMA